MHIDDNTNRPGDRKPNLKRGWTTGACATAAVKSALTALFSGQFLDPVSIILPKGETPSFALAYETIGDTYAEAGIIKDAGDDPDVTHGALIIARVSKGVAGAGLSFKAGKGVGTVTKPGLPLEVGQAAINPVPRLLIQDIVEEVTRRFGETGDIEIEIIVPEGERLAEKTWNPRLGIIGGISILGTTGIVHPFSCSAWIHSIHRGIDVARAEGRHHIAGATGSSSEKAVQKYYGLPDHAMIDMGDFVGGMLKYLRKNPVPKVTIGGGFAKLTKLAQGFMDLHSGRSEVDFTWLYARARENGLSDEVAMRIKSANTAKHAREIALEEGCDLAPVIAEYAKTAAIDMLRGTPIDIDIIVIDREGDIIAHAT